ncbi:uncharacterized protein LOC106638382 [Copidosoma floridanum]|uniref:uncharacterized protein LOC106638382 n=1 Tax=Copidosoma floridanum TaxID=29053 RepID=UPI0006C9BD1A|nr:uncharacterized protein LOC106638382 [Copidosoma floridanum]
MKFTMVPAAATVLLTFFTFHAQFIACMPTDATEPDWNQHFEFCAAEVGLLVEETKRSFAMPHEVPGNCVTACMWRKTGMMGENEKIIKAEMISSVHSAFKEIANITHMNEDDFYTCVDNANKFEGGCIVVSEYFKCLIEILMSTSESSAQ